MLTVAQQTRSCVCKLCTNCGGQSKATMPCNPCPLASPSYFKVACFKCVLCTILFGSFTMKLIELSSLVLHVYFYDSLCILYFYIKLVLYCMYGGIKNGILSIPLTKFVIVRLILSRRRVLYSTEYG